MTTLFVTIGLKIIDLLISKWINNEAMKKAMVKWVEDMQGGNTSAKLNKQYESLLKKHKALRK